MRLFFTWEKNSATNHDCCCWQGNVQFVSLSLFFLVWYTQLFVHLNQRGCGKSHFCHRSQPSPVPCHPQPIPAHSSTTPPPPPLHLGLCAVNLKCLLPSLGPDSCAQCGAPALEGIAYIHPLLLSPPLPSPAPPSPLPPSPKTGTSGIPAISVPSLTNEVTWGMLWGRGSSGVRERSEALGWMIVPVLERGG